MGEAYQIKNQEALFFLPSRDVGWAESLKSSRTTEIYAHVSMKSLKNIKNPRPRLSHEDAFILNICNVLQNLCNLRLCKSVGLSYFNF